MKRALTLRQSYSARACSRTTACGNLPGLLCQRQDKTYSRCGGIPDAGGKDATIDPCPTFNCASGAKCPPGCNTCGADNLCHDPNNSGICDLESPVDGAAADASGQDAALDR